MTTKSIFVACSVDDDGSRNLFTAESIGATSPVEIIGMAAEEPCSNEWKAWARSRIKRSTGVIALLSPGTPASHGEIWAIQCAFLEGKPLLGVWLGDYSTKPEEMKNAPCVVWTWSNVAAFIDRI